jgi:phospholipase C
MAQQGRRFLLLRVVNACLRNAGSYAATTCRPRLGASLGFAATHVFINRQAAAILQIDGWKQQAALFRRYLACLNAGVCRADGGLGCITHYYNPATGRGLWGGVSAADACTRFFNWAVRYWRRGDISRALYLIGLASHLVQDACVPQHVHGLVGGGHGSYELWVQQERERFPVSGGGLYRGGISSPAEWVIFNSRMAYDCLDLVSEADNFEGYERATAELLGLAQRSTAGFWVYFLEKVGAPALIPVSPGLAA